MAATRIKASMKPSTCKRSRALVHLFSEKAPMPAIPSEKIAPITLAVNVVRPHGQIRMAVDGTMPINDANEPTETKPPPI